MGCFGRRPSLTHGVADDGAIELLGGGEERLVSCNLHDSVAHSRSVSQLL